MTLTCKNQEDFSTVVMWLGIETMVGKDLACGAKFRTEIKKPKQTNISFQNQLIQTFTYKTL